MKRPGTVATLAASLLVLPRLAQAHLVTSGLGPYYDGALHLLMSPADLLGCESKARIRIVARLGS